MKRTTHIRRRILTGMLAGMIAVSAISVSASAANAPETTETSVTETAVTESEKSKEAVAAEKATEEETTETSAKKKTTETSSKQDTAVEKKTDAAVEETETTEESEDEICEEMQAFADRLKSLAGTLAEVALDELAEKVPGGKFIMGPIKSIFGDLLGSEDGTEAALKRIEEAQISQYNDMKGRIENLNKKMTDYTTILSKQTTNEGERENLGDMFRTLSVNLKDLSSKVNGIIGNKKYSPIQKLILLADVNNGSGGVNYLVNTRQAAEKINTTISNSGTKLDIDFYNTLFNLCASKYMFAGEAFAEAKQSAEPLTEQYMYANTLMLLCQNAAVCQNFTKDQIEEACKNSAVKAAYDRNKTVMDISFERDKYCESFHRIDDCVSSYKAFLAREKQGNRFINKGIEEEETVLDFVIAPYDGIEDKKYQEKIKNQAFDKAELEAFINYVRKTGKGQMSIESYLRKNNQNLDITVRTAMVKGKSGVTNNTKKYIIVDPTVKTTKKRNASKDTSGCGMPGFDNFGSYVYDFTETVKAVDISDPQCKVQDIVVATYSERYYTDKTLRGDKEYPVLHLMTIGSHAATEQDNIRIAKPGELQIQGPIKHEYIIEGPKTNRKEK